jgi:hypothetical protein
MNRLQKGLINSRIALWGSNSNRDFESENNKYLIQIKF